MLHIEKNGLDVSLILPERGHRYSPNLYRWLTQRNNPTRVWTSRVYRDVQGVFWIGILEGRELFGARLIGVLCNGAREETAAWQNVNAIEVPHFWDLYTERGRCAIDVNHQESFIDDAMRWRVVGDSRDCLWCGKFSQTMRRWTETIERAEWG